MTIKELAAEGYAIILWTPEELNEASPSKVEERLIELGWEVIESLQGE